MADPYVREVGRVEDMDARPLLIGVDYDAVTIGVYCFTAAQMEDVAQLIVSAVWQAGQQKARMDDYPDSERDVDAIAYQSAEDPRDGAE